MLYTHGVRTQEIVEKMAEKHGVSPRTIWTDLHHVRHRWDKEDRKWSVARRQRQVRALEDLALRCLKAGDRDGERQTRLAIGRLLGMGQPEPPAPTRINIHIGIPKVVGPRVIDAVPAPALPAPLPALDSGDAAIPKGWPPETEGG